MGLIWFYSLFFRALLIQAADHFQGNCFPRQELMDGSPKLMCFSRFSILRSIH